jgi:hypothetical protein
MRRTLSMIIIICSSIGIGSVCGKNTRASFPTENELSTLAGTITGPTDLCLPSTGSVYTVAGSSATSGYIWTLPTGGTITAGIGSKTITVSFSNANGGGMGQNISVTGNGLSASFSVNLYIKPTTGTLQGASSACQGQSGVAYSTSGFTNLTSFQWTPPSNVTLSSTTGGSTTATFASSFSSGILTVVPYNGTCAGTAATKVITGILLPAKPTMISGLVSVAPSASGVPYSVAAVSNATSYQWSVPSGLTIASGATTNSITLNFPSSLTGGYLYVYGINSTCNGSISNPLAINYPAAAGSISGNTSPCVGTSGTTVTYTVPTIPNATSYEWTLTDGTIVGASNTNSISVNFPVSIASGTVTITVRGINSLAAGTSSATTVTVYKNSGAAGAISGLSAVCAGQTGLIYSVPQIENAKSYSWSIPSGASILSGAGTNTVTLYFPSNYTGGNVTVSGLAGPCGSGLSSSISVLTPPLIPESATTISGSSIVCAGDVGVSYSVPAIANAVGYTWTLPPGATIASGLSTNSITVNYSASATSGTVSVYGLNCLGNGISSSLPTTIRTLPGAAGFITGNSVPCLSETGVTYSVPAITHASGYVWTVPAGATIVSGQNTNSIKVDYSLTATTGNVTVIGTNCKGNGAIASKAITYSNASLGSVGGGAVNYSVDFVTGTMNADLQLFSVQNGDVQLPGELSYSASGVRVTDDDGWVGQNWNLSIQSFGVFRQMRGLPDDYSSDTRRGWLFGTARTTIKNFIPTTDNDPATCADEASNYTTLNGISYDQDTEPDVFQVSVPGLSFSFYFDENRIPQLVPLQDLVITPYTAAGIFNTSTTTGPITSFIVTDSKGIQYTLSETESTTEKMYNKDEYYFVRRTNQHFNSFTYTTAWRLTKIISPIYGTIDVTYNTINLTQDFKMTYAWTSRFNPVQSSPFEKLFQLNYNYVYPLVTSNKSGAGSTLAYKRSSIIKIPSKITSSTNEVEFFSMPKSVGSLLQRLNSIKITDKRDGTSKVVMEIFLGYSPIYINRGYLTSVTRKTGCTDMKYEFGYWGSPPDYTSTDKDEWNFYKLKNPAEGDLQYDETAPAGTLSKIINPMKGFTSFFYETHDYWNGTANVQGGGIRIKKIINYDGVSTSNDGVQEFEYKTATGNSSGKLQHKAAFSFSVARIGMQSENGTINLRYREHQQLNPTSPISRINEVFTLNGDQDMSWPNSLNGSVVAYERVTLKTINGGKSVYEFNLPASAGETTANSGEWEASKVLIARPSTGSSVCFEAPNIPGGYFSYPFPVNSNYEFAKGFLKKVTNYSEAGIKVSDVLYENQNIYGVGDIGIRKMYGLALEELPTYYYNGSAYVDGKMFVYSRYALFTNVKSVLKKQTTTVYNSADEVKKSEVVTNYFYDSPLHRELTRIETINSDGTNSKQKFVYVKDYTITTPSGVSSTAIANLKTANRTTVVESISSKIISGTEKFLAANLTTFQTISGKVYPDKQYSFISNDGITSFTPSTISGGTTFQYDQANYVLDKSYLSFDSYGNSTEVIDRSKNVSAVAYGYGGTLPVINVANARFNEMRFSDFETPKSVDFSITWSLPTYGVGRNNSKALNMPAGSVTTNIFNNTLTNNKSQNYIISFWIKASTVGSLSLQVGATSNTTYTYPFTVSGNYKYYSFKVPIATVIGTSTSFYAKIWTSVGMQIDDLAFYPEQSGFITSAYSIPYGKTSETDSRGKSIFYENDLWGRLKVVYDRDGNVIKKYDYKTKLN